MRRLNPTTMALVIAGIVLLILIVAVVRGRGDNQDRLSDQQVSDNTAATPSERCASQRTYDVIKSELFRQAAETRGSDQAVFDRLAAFAVVRMERPVLKSQDESVGTIRCSGRLSLDLPPGVAVVGGRRTLSANVDYILQAAADDTGDVVILEGADPIIIPLATLARSGTNPQLPALPPPEGNAIDVVDPLGEVPADAVDEPLDPAAPEPGPDTNQPEPVPQATASPSFNCSYARSRGEIAVCRDPGLASLDRQMASQYFRAVAAANSRQRDLLRTTRNRFLAYRDRCRSDACIADAYRGRITEIGDIMAGRWNPPR